MWQTGLSSRVVNETKKKIDTNILGPKNVPPNLIDIVEGKGKGGWAKGRADETRDRGKPLQTKKKGYKGRKGPIPVNEKSDMTYQPFCDDGLRDPGCGQSGDPRAAF